MWLWMACAQGPLELPRGLEVAMGVPGGSCEPGIDVVSAPLGQWTVGALTNRSGDERHVTVGDVLTAEGDLEALGGVYAVAGFEDVEPPPGVGYAHEAPMGDGVSLDIMVGAEVHCIEARWPPADRYEREVPFISTDTLGGDVVEQMLEVVVRVE